MALAFKRGGKIDLAKRAMIRMTKMQEELKELVGDQPAATAAVAAPQPVPVVPTSAVQSSTAIVNAASPISAVVDQKASSPSPTESPVKAPTAGVIDAIEKMEFEMER